MLDIELAWKEFLQNEQPKIVPIKNKLNVGLQFSDLFISTKTIIAYLNNSIDLEPLFWKIPIMNYYKRREGILKKYWFVCISMNSI